MKDESPDSNTNTLLNFSNESAQKQVNTNTTISLVGYGKIDAIYNVSYTKILKYQQEIWHSGLNEHKVITAPDNFILKNKVSLQVDKWVEKWNLDCNKKSIEKFISL